MNTTHKTNTTIRATIIIVNYNHGDELARCVASVVQYTTSYDEIIVIDNGSHDGSADAIAAQYADVSVCYTDSNLGFGGACNIGAYHARGEYLVFLNPDTVVTAHWLDALIEALDGDATIGLVTSRLLLLHAPTTVNACGNEMHYTGVTMCRGAGTPYHMFTTPHDVHAVSGAACAIRHALFTHVGGFDTAFFLYMEDTDLSLRVRLAGYRCVCVPDSVVYHNYTLRVGGNKVFYQERNRYRMLLKNLRWETLARLLPALILAEIITWAFVMIQQPQAISQKLNAYISVLAQWHDIMQQRRQSHMLRRVTDGDVLQQSGTALDFAQVNNSIPVRLAGSVINACFALLKPVVIGVQQTTTGVLHQCNG